MNIFNTFSKSQDPFLQLRLETVACKLSAEMENFQNKLDSHFEFIQEEVEIRIESLRSKLNEIEKSFEEKLKQKKLEYKEHVLNSLKLSNHSKDIQKLAQDIKINSRNLQKQFHDLNEKIIFLRDYKINACFTDNELEITEDDVGSIRSQFQNWLVPLNFQIDNLNLKFLPHDVLKMKNGKYMVNRFYRGGAGITDSNFEEFENKFNLIGTKNITYDSDHFYGIGAYHLIKYNQDLKTIAIWNGEQNANMHETCSSLYYHNKIIYLCLRNTVKLMGTSFEDLGSVYRFDCKMVNDVKIIENIMCVSCCNHVGILKLQFWNKDENCKLTEYDSCGSVIAVYDSKFFIAYDGKRLLFFDANGNLLTIQKMDFGIASAMTSFDNTVFISLRDTERIVKITFNK